MPFRIAERELVDLHSHSVANDGRWRPDTLAQASAGDGIRVAALTDHDTTANVLAFAREAAAVGVYAVPGVEVTCWWRGAIYHVLCLGVDVASPPLQAVLADVWGQTLAVARRAAGELARRGRHLVGLEETRNGAYLPIDVINAAMRSGIAPTFPETVEVLVGEMGLSFTAGVDMERAIAACHTAGGVSVLAHPGRAEFGFNVATPELVKAMAKETGLDGVEVYHWSHGPTEIALYGRLAAESGLLVSCGSDSHGPNSARPRRGWEARLCRPLLERLEVEVIG